jgi:hypothetical protein
LKTRFLISCLTIILAGKNAALATEGNISAKTFAGPNQKLDRQQAALYIAYRDNEPLAKFISPNQTALDFSKVVDIMAEKLQDLELETGHDAPWTWQELDAAYPPQAKSETSPSPGWKNIEGVTTAKKFKNNKTASSSSLGPFRLRKTADDLTKKSLSDAAGATIGYTYNRLQSGDGAWNSQGILDYPVTWAREYGEYRAGRSLELQLGPAVEWNLAETQQADGKDVQELSFEIPTIIYFSPGRQKMTCTYEENIAAAGQTYLSALWVFQAKPYFQTDFSFQNEIYGATASAEFVGGIFGSQLIVGGFQDLGHSGLQYQLRVIPKLDYSVTERGGPHTDRKPGDDWFRLGGTVSLDFRLGGESFNSLDLGVSYSLFQAVSGSGGYSGLFKTHVTWWLTENIGPSLEYSKGETPVADEPIDLLALTLQLKY